MFPTIAADVAQTLVKSILAAYKVTAIVVMSTESTRGEIGL